MTTRNLAFLFSFFNLAGVFPLLGLAGAYRPNRYDEWISSVQEVPTMHSLSGVLFTVGVFCGVALGTYLMVHHKERFWTGLFLATGSTLNGLTTMFPFVLAQMTFDKEIGIISNLTADEFLDFVRADFTVSKMVKLATHHPKMIVRQLFNMVKGT